MTGTTPNLEPNHRHSLVWGCVVCLLYIGVFGFALQKLANRGIFRWEVWELTPAILIDHIAPTVEEGQPIRPSGWQYFPQRFDLLAVAGAMLSFAWAIGRTILRRVFRAIPPQSPNPPSPASETPDWLEHHYWSLVIGLAAWGTLTLLLGLAGLLNAALFWTIGGLAVLIEVIAIGRHRQDAKGTLTATPRSGWAVPSLLVIAPFLLAMLLGSLQPPNDFDVKEYHLGGAKEFFLQGHVGFLPHDVYTSFPFLTEMLCLSGMVLRGDWYRGALAGQVVLAVFAPLTALGLFITARRWLDNVVFRSSKERAFAERKTTLTAAWAVVVIHITCPWIYRISIIAYAEGGLACYLFATFLGVLRTIEATAPHLIRRWSLLTGLAAGAAAGCKYPGVLTVVIPAGLVLLYTALRPPRRFPSTSVLSPLTSHLFPFCFGVLLTFGPWLAKNLCETGNPVYPLLYGVFGGTDWDPASHAKWKNGHPLPKFTGLGHLLTDTRERLSDVFLGSDWQSAFYIALAPAAAWAIWRRRSSGPVLVFAIGYVVYLFATWQFLTHRIDRFWVPMLPILSLLAGAGLAVLWDMVPEIARNRTREVQFAARALTLFPVVLVVVCQLALATSPLGGNNNYLAPLDEARRLVKTHCVALVENLHLAPTDKVLFVGDAELFDAEFAYEYNTCFDHSIFERDCSAAVPNVLSRDQPLRPAADIRSTWQARGVTHIVVNWSELLRYRTTYQYTAFVHPQRFDQLVKSGLLEAVDLPLEQSDVPWEAIAQEKRTETLRWAPELKRETRHGETLRVFQVYRVTR